MQKVNATAIILNADSVVAGISENFIYVRFSLETGSCAIVKGDCVFQEYLFRSFVVGNYLEVLGLIWLYLPESLIEEDDLWLPHKDWVVKKKLFFCVGINNC